MTMPQQVQMIVRKRDGDMFDKEFAKEIAASLRGMSDMPVWQIVLICVISVAVPVAFVWWLYNNSPDWVGDRIVPNVVIGLVVLIICLVMLFWPQISRLLSGRTATYLALSTVALMVGGLVGWLLSRQFTDKN